MVIVGKRPTGYVINCQGGGESHKFEIEKLDEMVSCPTCGDNASAIDLMTNFIYLRRAVSFGEKETPVAQSVDPVDIANDLIFAKHRGTFG